MDGIASPGIEFYLPLFFSHEAMQGQSTLISYLPKNGIVITDKALEQSLEQFWRDMTRRYEDRRHNIDQPILPPETLFCPTNQLLEQLTGLAASLRHKKLLMRKPA